jgi:hypothetical protein
MELQAEGPSPVTLLIVLILGVGILLIYAAVKGENPKDVVLRALGR